MLRDKKFIIAISVSILLIVLIGVFRPREIDWSPTFSSADKIPYGTYILYNSLTDIFEKQEIRINTRSVSSLLHKKAFEKTSLIFVQSEFTPKYKDCKDLLAFAAQGNNLFISAAHLGRSFSDTLKITEKRALFQQVIDKATYQDTASFFEANFTNPQLHSDSSYRFKKEYSLAYYNLPDSFFNSGGFDSTYQITVLGVDAKNRPAFIRIKWRLGYIFIHNDPYAFSNYYMLRSRGPEYVARCFSYLSQDSVIWDEFYKNGTVNTKTALSFIISREPLRWAYYITVVFLLLFVLFNIKRRQRIIPVLDPFKNTSLEFTKTVGSLYFNQSNHKDIAKKKITYFLEFIRNRYNIDTAVLDEEFAHKLCYKTGISKNGVEHLLNVITGLESKVLVSSTDLIDLNHTIEYFKTNCQ